MPVQVKKLTDPLVLGEGPHWDARAQALYFVSINEKTIHKYIPDTGEHTKTTLDGRVGFIVPVEGTTDHFVVGVERSFLVVEWDGREGSKTRVLRELGYVDQGKETRINDGKCDPRGRLFAGTMGKEDPPGSFQPNAGSLFRLDGSTALTTVATGIGISNGLAWDVGRSAMYYTDSLELNIRRYDYDVNTGEISNMKHIFDFKKNNLDCLPDGTTIDTEGNLWVACFNGSCIIQVDPQTGKLLQKVPIPAKQVTSATFGGPDLDILFVTTASMNIGGEQPPPCGATFMVTGLGVRGHPNVNFKL